MSQLDHMEAIETRLWSAADNLRANSNYASNEYFLPVMGLVFLRHAYSRYLTVKAKIEPTLPRRGGKMRALTKEDFSQQSAIYLRPQAQFDYLVSFEALFKLVQELDDEAHRAVREGLDEESLAIFDLLKKPDLKPPEIQHIKAVATQLLARLAVTCPVERRETTGGPVARQGSHTGCRAPSDP